MKNDRILGIVALSMLIGQLALIILSWIVSAAAPDLPVRSLLSSEGVRWFLRLFGGQLSSPFLLWLILCIIAYGTLYESHLADALLRRYGGLFRQSLRKVTPSPLNFRERLALRFVWVEVLVFVVVLLLLTVIPHAVLLSSTGNLFPSSFSQSLIPILAFIVTVCSLSYGFVSGHLSQLSAIYRSLTSGFSTLAWLFPLYILGCQLYHSVLYVLGDT